MRFRTNSWNEPASRPSLERASGWPWLAAASAGLYSLGKTCFTFALTAFSMSCSEMSDSLSERLTSSEIRSLPYF